MRRILSNIFGILLVIALPARAGENIQGIFDPSPVSATNPAVARVNDCGIEVPASDFQAYAQSEAPPQYLGQTLTPVQKRAALENLLDEYFLIGWARRQKAEETAGFRQTMEETRKTLLREALQDKIASQATNSQSSADATKTFPDRLFEQADIKVFNEAYAELKISVKDLNGPSNANTNGTASSANLDPADRQRPLARYNDETITLADVLQVYLKMDPAHRPNLQKQEGLIEILKTMLEPSLMVAEAHAERLEQSPFMRGTLALNRCALLRFYAQDRITDKAVAQMKSPDIKSQLKQWFDAHLKDRYTYKDEQGKDKTYSFDAEQDRLADDYFEDQRERLKAETVKSLRNGHAIQINEPLLARMTVSLPAPAPTDLTSSVVAWDADTETHVVAPGETNALFTFHLANVSSNDVTIYDVHPSCECTTMHLPDLPWTLTPGKKGEFQASVDVRGKTNSYSRTIYVESSSGGKTLTLKVNIPASSAPAGS